MYAGLSFGLRIECLPITVLEERSFSLTLYVFLLIFSPEMRSITWKMDCSSSPNSTTLKEDIVVKVAVDIAPMDTSVRVSLKI